MAVATVTPLTAAAEKMAEAIEVCRWRESSRLTLYFAADGRRLTPGGRAVMDVGAVTDGWHPKVFAVSVRYPFCPSVLSCADLLAEHAKTKRAVVYDEERWEEDPRILEQAGPSLVEDWALIEIVGRRMAA